MTRVSVRTAAALILLGAAVALFIAASLPPQRLTLTIPPDANLPLYVRGAVHVHSNRSDGRSSPDDIAAAAARAGLDFLVLTDHGDATRPPDPPAYRSGVLVLDGVEISTDGGHYVAIDMPAAPYPLGGEARDVVEDVRRLGGFGIVAHPDSPKQELRWRDWEAPFDAVELVNPDTSWRARAIGGGWRDRAALLGGLLTYPFRPEETVAGFLRLSDEVINQWASLTAERRVVAMAGLDAHARLSFFDADPGDNALSLPFPGYESLFRTLSVHVRVSEPFTRDAPGDARTLMRAIRAGELFMASNGIAGPPAVSFSATRGDTTAAFGEELPAPPEMVTAWSNAPARFDTRIWQGRTPFAGRAGGTGAFAAPVSGPGALWMTVHRSDRSDAPVWLVTNPVYTALPENPPRTAATLVARSEARRWLVDDASMGSWATEHDPASTASLRIDARGGGPELTLEYALAPAPAAMPFAALSVFTRGGMLAGFEAVEFEAHADRPMRISVQLRAEDVPTVDHRWARSVYVDATAHAYRIPFDDFRPIGGTTIARPPPPDIHSIVFAVETTNTAAGTSGQFTLRRVGVD